MDLSLSLWLHIFRIPRLGKLPFNQLSNICDNLPDPDLYIDISMTYPGHDTLIFPVDIQKLKIVKDSFCTAYGDLLEAHKELLKQTNMRGNKLYNNMQSMTIDLHNLQIPTR